MFPEESSTAKAAALTRSSAAASEHPISPWAAISLDANKIMHRSPQQQKAMDPRKTEDKVFESVAELFSLLSTPIRLKIISAVCHGEKNVSELLSEIDTTQPNMSQHLSTLYRSGVLSKRREGTQIYYKLQSDRVAALCRAVCTQVAAELDPETEIEAKERLMPAVAR